jgi:hypothetical protein
MADPTGEADRNALRLNLDHRLMLQFRSSVITSDAGLLAYRVLSSPPANGRWSGLFAWDEVCGGKHAGKVEADG